jgi:GNAT superfamily N-acetyltransferase
VPIAAPAGIVRTATPDDAARLAELSGTLGYPVSTEAMRLRIERLLNEDGEIVLVAEQPAGRVVGWLHGSEQELLESGTRCEILGLVVDEVHRHQGTGRALVAAVEAWSRQRGLQQIAVRSNIARIESHGFYEHLGYIRTKSQHAYRKALG